MQMNSDFKDRLNILNVWRPRTDVTVRPPLPLEEERRLLARAPQKAC